MSLQQHFSIASSQNQGSSGMLRHRRASPKGSTETGLQQDDDTLKNDQDPQSMQQDPSSDDDGYQLTPLIQRSLWMRLDVAPFLLSYLVLVAMDHSSFQDETSSLLVTLLFAAVLLAHLGLFVLQQWSVPLRVSVGYSKSNMSDFPTHKRWTHCWVTTRSSGGNGTSSASNTSGESDIVPVQWQTQQSSSVVAVVTFQDVVFRCPQSRETPDLDVALWSTIEHPTTAATTTNSSTRGFARLHYPDHLPIDVYVTWKGHNQLDILRQAHQVYGDNVTRIELPSFWELLQQQVVAPFFLFQIVCVVLWSLDEYWYYALFTLMALLLFESTVAYNRLQSLQRLRTMGHKAGHIFCWRPHPAGTGAWAVLPTSELLPGDVVSLSASTGSKKLQAAEQQPIPADVLLMDGTAVVDEALLTGESIPQLKVPLDQTVEQRTTTTSTRLDVQEHKQSILFGGTTLLVSNPPATNDERSFSQIPPPPDRGVVGIVLRTSFETAQGSLLRTMAHSSKKPADGIHTEDTFVFIFILLCCAIASAYLVWMDGWQDETRNRFRLGLHVIIIVTSVVPPELPMELSLAVTNSVSSLVQRCQVYCTEQFRIPWAGQVNICCFDKTGTLTSDEMQLKGVALLESDNDDMDALVPPESLPWPTLRVMAACHSLAWTGPPSKRKGTSLGGVIGDPLERAVFATTKYGFVQNNRLEPENGDPSLVIHHRFAFSSRLKRMTVLASQENQSPVMWALTKGAPETIKNFLLPDSVPDNYDQIATHHMSRGRRVLAMAYRNLGNQTLSQLKDSGREAIETDLTFCGFLVLDCPLKPDSKSVILDLRKSGHEVVMVTGDAVLTAAEVARQVGIIAGKSASDKEEIVTYQLQKHPSALEAPVSQSILSQFAFVPLGNDGAGKEALSLDPSNLMKLKQMVAESSAAFCVSGQLLELVALEAVRNATGLQSLPKAVQKNALLHPAAQLVLKELVPLICVFARHAPRQKEAVVAAFNLGGYYTLMCGDGTNDVGALKRAHVGISIISAPEVEAKQRRAKENISRVKNEEKRERKAKAKGKSKVDATKKRQRVSVWEESLRQLQEAQEELNQVELGDASVASPFTSRASSIKCCSDVLQQGRCTLVTMLQIYKILGVNCLVNALVLSKLSMHGVKQGDRQMTIIGLVIAALFLFVTRTQPLPSLSPIRPPSSVLSLQTLLSIAVQFGIHYTAIMAVTEAALSFVDPYDPSMAPDGPFNPNVLNTCTFLVSVLAIVNTFAINYRGRPFTEDLRENKMLLRSLQLCYGVLFTCALNAFPPLNDLLQLSEFPSGIPEDAGDDEWIMSVSEAGGLAAIVRSVDFPVFLSSVMLLDTVLAFQADRLITWMLPS